MSIEIALSDNGRFLIATVSGEMTVEKAGALTCELDRLSRETGIKRFLTDVRDGPNVARVAQNYNYAHTTMPELELQRDARSAILASPHDHSHDFIETLARNAGYNVRVFHDHAQAVAWLELP